MLFVMVIDVLNQLFRKAMDPSVMKRLSDRHMASSLSVHVDDVMLFCHPDASDLAAAREILMTFGEMHTNFGMASELHTNLAKCSAQPIWCPPLHR